MERLLTRPLARGTLLGAAMAVALAGCSSGPKSSSPRPPERPETSARIQLLSPTPNQETGPDVTVQVRLIGAHEVPAVTGTIKPDEGHIHVSLDGTVVAMAYGDTQQLKALTPGQHAVQVDFVAVDHVPFKNRVTAAVLFNVKP
jgi:hypothetical protein